MKKLLLTLTIASLVVFTSCKENAAEKINQENVTKAAERDSKAIVFPSISFDKTEHDFGQIMNGTPVETTFSYTNSTNTQTGREQVRISAFITPDPNAPVVKKQ